MNIAVCISCVPDTTSKINFTEENTKFDTSGVQFVINPYDEFGLTKAIMLKEKHGGKVTVLTVGDISVEPIIRKALAIGADEAVRIDASPIDSTFVAINISNYIENNPQDIIICGRESIDYNTAAVPAMLAEKLNLPFINACIGIEINNNDLKATREIDGGKEITTQKIPLVVAGQKGLVEENELRIPNMRGIMSARSKPLSVIKSITKSYVKSLSFKKPPAKESCKLINSSNIKELIELLHSEAKVI